MELRIEKVMKLCYLNPIHLERGWLEAQTKSLRLHVLYMEEMTILTILVHTKTHFEKDQHELGG